MLRHLITSLVTLALVPAVASAQTRGVQYIHTPDRTVACQAAVVGNDP